MKNDLFPRILSNFVERLKELCFYHNLTPADLADSLEISTSSIYHYLEGFRLPELKVFVRIADFFHCTSDFLLGFEEQNSTTVFNPMPPFKKHFPILMEQLKTNKYQIRKNTGIPHSTIYSWQSGATEPSLISVILIAKKYEVSVDFVLGREK